MITSRWYRISDQKPPEKMTVIVQLSDHQQGLGELTISGEWRLHCVLATGSPVVAWMHMPAPCAVESA